MFLEISQNSQENSCAGLRPTTLLKMRLWRKCFPVNFVKFLRTSFSQNTFGRLLLKLRKISIFIENLHNSNNQKKSPGGVLLKITVLESLFSKVVGPKACNFIKQRLQHSCLHVSLEKFSKHLICERHLTVNGTCF